MTGGIGFSRQGQDSLKQNRDLTNKRPMLKDRLHTTSSLVQGRRILASYEQLLRWKKMKDQRSRSMNLVLLIFLLIAVSICLMILI